MNNNYRYKLASNKVPKINCPKCNARRHWQRYIDTETGNILPDQFGRCDNQVKCGHSFNPYSSGYAKSIWLEENNYSVNFVKNVNIKSTVFFPETKEINLQQNKVFIPKSVLLDTLNTSKYQHNSFINNLLKNIEYPFEPSIINKAIEFYYLGTIADGYRRGAVTFPFINFNGDINAIQAKQFDKENHTISTDFIHSIILNDLKNKSLQIPQWLNDYNSQEKKITCLFGEHLISKFPNNPIAIVEAPKTAIYCSLYFGFPDESPNNIIWLAVYNKSSFTLDKVKILQGKYIYVFPDASSNGITFNEWKQKANEFEKTLNATKFIFSDFLEQFAPDTDKQKGYDIADYLIETDWRDYRKTNTTNIVQQTNNKLQTINNEQQTQDTNSNSPFQIPEINDLCNKNPNIKQLIKTFDLIIEK